MKVVKTLDLIADNTIPDAGRRFNVVDGDRTYVVMLIPEYRCWFVCMGWHPSNSKTRQTVEYAREKNKIIYVTDSCDGSIGVAREIADCYGILSGVEFDDVGYDVVDDNITITLMKGA